jgi:hypothetical protein
METFQNVFAIVFVSSLWLFMLICGNWQGPWIFNNDYSKICKRARDRSVFWPILGNGLQVIAVVMTYLMATDSNLLGDWRLSYTIFGLFLPVAFSWLAFGGFNFSYDSEEE